MYELMHHLHHLRHYAVTLFVYKFQFLLAKNFYLLIYEIDIFLKIFIQILFEKTLYY